MVNEVIRFLRLTFALRGHDGQMEVAKRQIPELSHEYVVAGNRESR